MFTTTNMSLTAWDLQTDPYDHSDLVNNWTAIDAHDHTPGKGAPLIPASIPVLGQENLGVCSVTRVQICDGEVINQKLASPAVKEVNLYDNSVTAIKIANSAVGNTELATSAVSTVKLQDGSVTTPKIADSAVSNVKINNGAVSNTKIGTDAVTESKIQNYAVSTEKIQNYAVTNSRLAENAVTQNRIADNAVGAAELDVLPAAYLAITGRIIVAPNTFHVIQWHQAKFDTNFMTFPGGIYIQTPGIYSVTAGVMWDDTGAGASSGSRRARIRCNNTPIAGDGPHSPTQDDPSSPFRLRQSLAVNLNLYRGDVIDVLVQHTSTHNAHVTPDGWNTHLSVVYLSPRT